MKRLLLCAGLLLSVPVFGQSSQQPTPEQMLPDSASTSKITADNTSALSFVIQPIRSTPPVLLSQSGPPREGTRVADRSFILPTLFQIGATIGDIESTQYGLSHGVREANPLYGSHPSRAMQYGITMPIAAAIVGWSYRLKKSAPHSRYWLIPPVVVGSIHTPALGHNLMVARTK